MAFRRIRSLVCAGMVAVAGLLVSSLAMAAPGVVTHQGRLFDASNQPITATLDVELDLYANVDDTVPIWSEVHSVTFDDGYFSIALGSVTPFDADTFDGTARYLGITVGADPEMTPRALVGSVPYALSSEDATGDIHPSSVSVNGITVINASGQWVGSSSGLQGPQGPQGPQGGVGAQGPAGAQGATGPMGPAGPQGPTGNTGPTGVQGPAGPAGPQGNQGAMGPMGLQGAQGNQGSAGAAGPQGPMGVAGATGPAGPTGPTGAPGATGIVMTVPVQGSIASISASTAGWVFVGGQATVTIAAGQKLSATGVAALGLGTAATEFISHAMCWKSATSTVTPFYTGGTYTLDQITQVRLPYAAAGVVTGLAAGTYQVGYCISYSGTNLTNNDWTNLWVQVAN